MICPVTGKVSYDSRRKAKRAMRRVHNRDVQTCRTYRCSGCGFLHLGHLRPAVIHGWMTRAEAYGDAA